MKKENLHAHSPSELQKNLRDIEDELKKPIDKKKMQKIFQKLEVAQEDCSLMKSKYTLSSEKFLSNFEDRICSLFGTVVTSHVDREIDLILKAASNLTQKNLHSSKSLKKKIKELKSWHRPSRENLIKLAEAEKKIGIIHLSEHLDISEIDSVEAENLLEIASLVYHKNTEGRNKLYLALSEPSKERLQKHLIYLKTKAFEKETPTIQALFVSAFEMAGIPTQYPSYDEIKEFFSEENN